MLHIEHVRKHFGETIAVDDVSLDVGAGEIVALLGPNGAGKTTLLRMIVGIFNPDSGRIARATSNAANGTRPIGYLPEERGLYEDMTVSRALVFFGVLHGMTRREAQRASGPWLERLALTERAGDQVKTFSKGNQQKVQFACALLHRPALAILDEPFSGLDPVNQDLFVDIVRSLRADGTTVLFSAHQMPLVERLADRIFLINRGREVLHGTVADIRREWEAGERLILGLAAGGDRSFFEQLPGVESVERFADDEVRLRLKSGESMSALLRSVGERFDVRYVRSEEVTLHEIYVQTVAEVAR